LLELAAEKDTDFETTGFLEALSSLQRLTTADFGITEAEYERLRVTVESWRSILGREQGREPPDSDIGLDR
jgi:hypothetical protein